MRPLQYSPENPVDEATEKRRRGAEIQVKSLRTTP